MNSHIVLILWAFLASISAAQNETEEDNSRNHKALSIFQIVRFPNKGCVGSGSQNGTCYTSSECTSKAGISSGSCASGFGVCCVFQIGCGGTTSENCTYFQSSTTQPAGQCSIKICKCSSDICQIRIDFNSFVLAGPNTVTLSIGKEIGGSFSVGAGVAISAATQCVTDTFSITGPAGSVPPVICGTNTGEHVYVDATDSCNTASFQLGQAGIGTAIPSRSWSLKISQLSCYDANLAPSGCTQYYYGGTSGMIQSFNYVNRVELANQNQRICFRRERGFCRTCFSAAAVIDFGVSAAAAIGYVLATKCCGYGAAGIDTKGYDCVMIPGATKAAPLRSLTPSSICGNGAGLVTGTGAVSKTICTSQTPFQFNFLTDAWTMVAGVTRGFKLDYFQTTC